jgi:type IV pilus assembly protein PilB
MNTVANQSTDAQPLIVSLLLAQEMLSDNQLEQLYASMVRDRCSVQETLIGLGFVTEQQIAQMYADHLFLPLYDPHRNGLPDNKELSKYIPERMCRDLLIAPLRVERGCLDVVFATPNELMVIDELQMQTGLQIRASIGRFTAVERAINALYGGGEWVSDDLDTVVRSLQHVDTVDDTDPDEEESEVIHLDQPTPPGRDGRIVRLVNQVLSQALTEGASDIHIEPFEQYSSIRFRIDGKLIEIAQPARSLMVPVVSRLKVLARIDIAEKRVPQDGAISQRTADRRVDLRVSTMPTVHGEKVVLRVLDKRAIPVTITELGLTQQQADDLTDSLSMPHGLILVTGPTGSGKSTTLYSCLNGINDPERNICTVEDPVEYKFEGINQVQVRPKVGLSFASALRAFLRQDPDIIMVGEVRDQETAEICMRAALTGHLVLSTLHTNDALSAVGRLLDMGIEPFMLGSTLRVLQAQRLLRRLCPECRVPYDCDAQTSARFGFDTGQTLYRARGCDQCRGTGYRGRVGVFEVIQVTPTLENLIQQGAPLDELRCAAQADDVSFLLDSALDKVREGITSVEIALSVKSSLD